GETSRGSFSFAASAVPSKLTTSHREPRRDSTKRDNRVHAPVSHIIGSIRLGCWQRRVHPVCNVLVRTDTIWRRAKQSTIDLKRSWLSRDASGLARGKSGKCSA